MTDKKEIEQPTLIPMGVATKNGFKLFAYIPLDELRAEKPPQRYTLFNPVEYAFFRSPDDARRILTDCIPYVLGYQFTNVLFAEDQIESMYQLDDTTAAFYKSHSDSYFRPLEDKKKDAEDEKDKKGSSNILTLH